MANRLQIVFVATATIVNAVVLCASSGRSQEAYGMHGDGHASLHKWYETLTEPGTGISCCSDLDCRPTVARVVGGTIEVMVDGEWMTVPPDKILNTPSPDLRSHVCASMKTRGHGPLIYCVVIGLGV